MDKKKRILFILGTLDSGGVSKSLVNLLNVIDRQKYDVSLLLCSQQMGPYGKLLPHDIQIITDKQISSVFSIKGIPFLLKHRCIGLALGVLLRLFMSIFSKAYAGYILSRLMPAIPGTYDLIVDYNGQHQTYYMVDKLKAKKKVAFFHSDYAMWPYYYRMDKRYYPKLDAIFTISPQCVTSLRQYFPEQSDKIRLMENISSLSLIEQMASEKVSIERKAKWMFLTVGHITRNKGTDLAIRAGKILQNQGIDFEWFFIGNTAELPRFRPLLEELGVQDRFRFLGIQSNPYPYFKVCDIVVHPSLFEGKSVTLDEAKLLCKPVVVTNFSTVRDQFENGVNARIVEMKPECIAKGMLDLITKPSQMESFISYLRQHRTDNISEINKIYNLCN